MLNGPPTNWTLRIADLGHVGVCDNTVLKLEAIWREAIEDSTSSEHDVQMS